MTRPPTTPIDRVNALPPRQRRELDAIRRLGRCSRVELHERLGLRKATVTEDAADLLELGLVREAEARQLTSGRPRLPLEIDPDRHRIAGVAIDPGVVQVQRVDLLGNGVGRVLQRRVRGPGRLLGQARRLLEDVLNEHVLAVGVTVPGFIEPEANRVLFSSAWPDSGPVDLTPLAEAAAPRQMVMGSLTTTLAGRLAFDRPDLESRDDLVISFGDGHFGAALLIAGRPITGVIAGANELGHNRLPIDTPRCYCGHTGCLERVFSTPFLRSREPSSDDLETALRRDPDAQTPAVAEVTRALAMGVANAVNFCRVGEVIFSTRVPGSRAYLERLIERVRAQLLRELRDRVSFSVVVEDGPHGPRNAATLALARVCYAGETPPTRYPPR